MLSRHPELIAEFQALMESPESEEPIREALNNDAGFPDELIDHMGGPVVCMQLYITLDRAIALFTSPNAIAPPEGETRTVEWCITKAAESTGLELNEQRRSFLATTIVRISLEEAKGRLENG